MIQPNSNPPEIVINGRFLMQPITGVQRVARELTVALDRLVADEAFPVTLRLVCEPEARLDDLDLRATTVERAASRWSRRIGWRLGGHAWEQLVLPGRVRGGHLLCLGNTAPFAALHRRAGAQAGVAVMIHDLSYRQFPDAYRLHYRLGHRFMLPSLLRRAQTIITVSEREKAMLAALRPEARGRIHVAQNGGWGGAEADGTGSGNSLPALPAPGYMLYVGSLSRRKNIHGVVEVAVRLAREDGRATLIVGGGSDILAPIAAEIPADVAHLVRFTGPVTELDALGRLYRDAGCLLFPSFYEASPLPPIEAMYFGCPVVVSAIPAMTERCGTAALYCDPHDGNDMLATVRHALANAAPLAARGRLHAAHWTWRDQAARVVQAVLDGATPATQEKARRSVDAPAGEVPGNGFMLADAGETAQQAPCPRTTEGTVSSRMPRLSDNDRERA